MHCGLFPHTFHFTIFPVTDQLPTNSKDLLLLNGKKCVRIGETALLTRSRM